MGVKLLIMVSYERNNHSKFPKTFIFSFIWPRKSKIAPKKSKTMTLIGNGAQCEFQAIAFQEILGINHVRLFDIDSNATSKVANH